MSVDREMSRRARLSKTPWRGNPMCSTQRALDMFKRLERDPERRRQNAARDRIIAELRKIAEGF